MRSRILVLIFLSLLLNSLSACATSALVLTEDDQSAIYTAVVRQLYTVDHTFGDKPPNWPVIYLLRNTDDKAGNPRATEARTRLLAESVQEAIVAALDGLPAEFVWVDDRREVIDESIMAVKGNGALITLGNTYLQKDGKVQVAASIYFSSEGAGGATYIIEKLDSIWQITGYTGVRWIS